MQQSPLTTHCHRLYYKRGSNLFVQNKIIYAILLLSHILFNFWLNFKKSLYIYLNFISQMQQVMEKSIRGIRCCTTWYFLTFMQNNPLDMGSCHFMFFSPKGHYYFPKFINKCLGMFMMWHCSESHWSFPNTYL